MFVYNTLHLYTFCKKCNYQHNGFRSLPTFSSSAGSSITFLYCSEESQREGVDDWAYKAHGFDTDLFSIFLIVNKSNVNTKTNNALVQFSIRPYPMCGTQPQAHWPILKTNGSQMYSFIFKRRLCNFPKQLGTVDFSKNRGVNSAFDGDYFWSWILVNVYSSRKEYVGLTQNKLRCPLICELYGTEEWTKSGFGYTENTW